MAKLNVVGLSLGDPLSLHSRSGVNYNVFSRLSRNYNCIDIFDLDLRGGAKAWSAIKNFSFNRKRWGNKLHQNPWAFSVRTRVAEKMLNKIKDRVDFVFQDGAMFMPGKDIDIPFVSYHDSNVILSSEGGQFSQGAHYFGYKLRKTIEQEREVYRKATIIFTMSDWLKQSLIADFGVDADNIHTVYAGVNTAAMDFVKEYDGKTILFVGKDFERKGGEVVVEAFKLVRQAIKGARLIVVGSQKRIGVPGVCVQGLIIDRTKMADCFKQSSLFVMPSMFEPFGIVFAEAFGFRLPCIGANICATPEIIEEGKGGYLVDPGDPKMLAEKMIRILSDMSLMKQMGDFGFEKVQRYYNWDAVVDRMVACINKKFGCSQ